MTRKSFKVAMKHHAADAFTLAEILVSVAVLALLLLIFSQLVNHTATVTRTGTKHIDTDTQARAVLDRMALDFARMLKRTDIDYYFKAPIGYKNPKSHGKGLKLKTGDPGNDQVAFFSQVPGYNSTSSSWQSPVSLVAYRVNADLPTSKYYLQLERMGKGLLWNGVVNTTNANSPYPIVFSPGQIAAGTGPWSGPWYGAVNNDNSANSADPDYEQIGAQVFRFEYYYLLKDGSITDVPKILCPTCTPPITWNSTQSVSANINAFGDVEAIVIVIAVIDPASRSLLNNPSTPTDPYKRLFNMVSDMADFKNANGNGIGAQKVGDVENEWNAAVQHAATTGQTYDGSSFPPAVAASIRIYNRYFDLRTPASL